jgi:hypothetical protein
MGSQDANTLSLPHLAIITSMQVTFDIPDTRAALEALLVEGYRTRRLSEGQIKRSLGYGTLTALHLLARNSV